MPATLAEPPAPRVARRAIFIDVENTSSESALLRILEHLNVDHIAQPTEMRAVGNWKAVGIKVARTLAKLGAQLVHSAPAVGVRDWSDLWIAVAAGRWLGHAEPGDVLEIVSDDRAFDAVADAAAAVGVIFHRISYRTFPVAAEAVSEAEPARRPHRRGGRGRRGHGGGPRVHEREPAASESTAPPPAAAAAERTDEEAHAASQEQIRLALARLTGGDPTKSVNLDALANTLRDEGFNRPPGSPRLVTRLRKIKGVEVLPNSLLRLVSDIPPVPGDSAAPVSDAPRRPRRRGGRRHRRPTSSGAARESAGGATSS